MEPSSEAQQGYEQWMTERPECVRKLVTKHGFNPWTLYQMKSTKHIVTIYSYSEHEDGTVTLTVSVSLKFNRVLAFERNVFGVKPEDLEECALPQYLS